MCALALQGAYTQKNPKVIRARLRNPEAEKGRRIGQVTKSTRGMPWHWEPKKDVAIYEKPREVESRL